MEKSRYISLIVSAISLDSFAACPLTYRTLLPLDLNQLSPCELYPEWLLQLAQSKSASFGASCLQSMSMSTPELYVTVHGLIFNSKGQMPGGGITEAAFLLQVSIHSMMLTKC